MGLHEIFVAESVVQNALQFVLDEILELRADGVRHVMRCVVLPKDIIHAGVLLAPGLALLGLLAAILDDDLFVSLVLEPVPEVENREVKIKTLGFRQPVLE